MTLLNPRGLWLLAAVPLLILIHLLLQKHRDTPVGSAYLWRVSERFRHKSRRRRTLTVGLCFFLQLAVLCLCALAASEPAILTEDRESLLIVVDASGSMRTTGENGSRFDRALSEAAELTRQSSCDRVTVIAAGDVPYCVITDGTPQEAREALEKMQCGFGSGDLSAAIRLSDEVTKSASADRAVLYTDMTCPDAAGMEVIDVSADEVNSCVTGLTQTAGGFSCTVMQQGTDGWLAVRLYLDGNETEMKSVYCRDGEAVPVEFHVGSPDFSVASATVSGLREDGLPEDDSCCLIGRSRMTVSVLVTGIDTVFCEEALSSLGGCSVTVVDEYSSAYDGHYDLYVLSGNLPETAEELPRGGLLLAFANVYSSESIQYDWPDMAGLSITILEPRDSLRCAVSDPLLTGMEDMLSRVYVARQIYPDSFPGWTPLTCLTKSARESSLVRVTEDGDRQYLFLFGTRDSNIALTPAYLTLLDNAMKLSATSPVGKTAFVVGEAVSPALPEQAENAAVRLPDGTPVPLPSDSPVFVPSAPGVHTLTYTTNGLRQEVPLAVSIPESEYLTTYPERLSLPERQAERQAAGSTSLIPYVCIAALLLLVIEWGYCCHGRD